MPRLSWSCRKVCRSSPTPRQNDKFMVRHPRWGAVCPNWARTVLCGGRFRFGLRSMPPATTTAVPLQGDHLSHPTRRPGCQPNAGPQRLGGGTSRSSGSCAPQSRARPSFSLVLGPRPKRRPRGIGSVTQSRAPHAGALYAYALTLDRHQPMTSAKVLGRSWVGG